MDVQITMDVRAQAAKLIANLLRNNGSLTTLLPTAAEAVVAKDRSLLQELCYGVCRWYPRLDKILAQLLDKPLRTKDSDIQALLAIGLYQIIFLRTPDHAALNTTVAAAQSLNKTWAKHLINAVLRQYLRQRESLEQALASDPVYRTAHPAWLLEMIAASWPDFADEIFANNNLAPPFTLRVNRQKISRANYQALLQQQGVTATPNSLSPDGLTLQRAVPVSNLPRFDDGFCSVQDEAPQLTAQLLRCESHHRILDACSAPGGKTAHLLETFPALRILALDVAKQRVQRTRTNLQRLQLQADLEIGDALIPSSWWDGQLFDRILLDAPCSATGIIRRQPDIKILRSPDSLAKLVDIQQQLLIALWPLLKPGGELLYATCSILPDENTQVVETFLCEQSDARHIAITENWGIAQQFGRQLLPQAQSHDGFYYARLRKGAG